MPDDHLPKQLLCGEICEGRRSVGGQKKRFKDTLTASLKSTEVTSWETLRTSLKSIEVTSWETLACDRSSWRGKISAGVLAADKQSVAEAEIKRAARADQTTVNE